jgi:hypothetical protein
LASSYDLAMQTQERARMVRWVEESQVITRDLQGFWGD